MEQSESIKLFAENFFKNLKCTLNWEGNLLKVSNVPKDFEEFSGRGQPYTLVFKKEDEIENADLMIKGSYLLRTMMEYLEGRGQTTLLKLVFEFDPKEAFAKKFNLANCGISNITRKQDYKILTRFTFLSSFQYKNEKDKLTNSIYVKDNSLIDLNLEKFSSVEGRKEDIGALDIKQGYSLAKGKLKHLVEGKTKELHEMLQTQIRKEIARVREHCWQQKLEHENSIKKMNQQIKNLEKEFAKTKDKSLLGKISKIRESLKTLENSDALHKIEKEEEFFINDEIHKHGLSVKHKMINTSIFYYPKYSFTLFLKSANGGRIAEIDFDPLFEEWGEISCDNCSEKIKEIFLCSGGHLSCKNCAMSCKSCGKDSCKKCLDKSCNLCGKECCKKCISRCRKCNNYVCSSHILSSGSNICMRCVKNCYSCRKACDPSDMRKNQSGSSVCNSCYQKSVQEKIGRVFER